MQSALVAGLLVLAVVLGLCSSQAAVQPILFNPGNNCSFNYQVLCCWNMKLILPKGNTYDFSPLIASNGSYVWNMAYNGTNYQFQIQVCCQPCMNHWHERS